MGNILWELRFIVVLCSSMPFGWTVLLHLISGNSAVVVGASDLCCVCWNLVGSLVCTVVLNYTQTELGNISMFHCSQPNSVFSVLIYWYNAFLDVVADGHTTEIFTCYGTWNVILHIYHKWIFISDRNCKISHHKEAKLVLIKPAVVTVFKFFSQLKYFCWMCN